MMRHLKQLKSKRRFLLTAALLLAGVMGYSILGSDFMAKVAKGWLVEDETVPTDPSSKRELASSAKGKNGLSEKTTPTVGPGARDVQPGSAKPRSPMNGEPADGMAWKLAMLWLGGESSAKFDSSGRLAVLEVSNGRASSIAGFAIDNPEHVRARTQEVIDKLGLVLGISTPSELKETQVVQSLTSASVSYQQYVNGLPLVSTSSSAGSIRVNISRTGSIVSLYSDYRPNLEFLGKHVVSEEAARSSVTEKKNSGESLPPLPGSRPVALLSATPDGRSVAIPAFEVWNQGRQYAVHGETGRVLWFRDRRVH